MIAQMLHAVGHLLRIWIRPLCVSDADYRKVQTLELVGEIELIMYLEAGVFKELAQADF